jgi:hypothetical protein
MKLLIYLTLINNNMLETVQFRDYIDVGDTFLLKAKKYL